MTFSFRHAVSICTILIMSVAAAASFEARQAQPQDSASVEGVVLQAGSGAPVSHARVMLVPVPGTLMGPQGPTPLSPSSTAVLTVSSGDDGRFAFSGVMPGTYQLIATRDGFVRATFSNVSSARTPTGSAVSLKPREALKNVTLSMTPTGTVSGRIRNAYGDPVGNVNVQAHQFVFQEGVRKLSSVLEVLTNDLGEYRMYYLPPGQYFVTATPAMEPQALKDGTVYIKHMSMIPGSPLSGVKNSEKPMTPAALAALGVVGSGDTGETYLPVFYPGTTDASAAMPIDLKPAATFANADFVIQKVNAVRVRGKIAGGAQGTSPGKASVYLMSTVTGYNFGLSEQSGTVSDSGAFEFRGVAPGTYDVVATLGDLPDDISFPGSGYPGGAILETFSFGGPPAGNVPPPAPRLVAKTSIQVGNTDVNNITLQLGSGYKLNGKIEIEGRPGPQSNAMTANAVIQLVPDPETFETAPMPAKVGPTGAFTITGLIPGRYQVAIMEAEKVPQDAFVKSVLLDNIDAINPRLVVTGEPRGDLEIVLSTSFGTLITSVKNSKQDSAAGARVVIIPDVPRRQHFELYQSERVDESGSAAFRVPAGDYTVYAWENIEAGEWWDPAFLQKYEGTEKSVHITADGTQKLELTSQTRK